MITGKIQINEHTIARYEIKRKPPFNMTPNTIADYHCLVKYTGQDGYPMVADFETTHKYGDGALALVGKVMLECAPYLRRQPVRE